MSVPQLELAVNRIGSLLSRGRIAECDSDLLRAFCRASDQAAFSEIVRRHGGLVRSVCRRVLGDRPVVDDAWQATFLVLARRASSVGRSGSIAGWLHGVAYRTALNERRAMRRRTAHEARARVPSMTSPEKQAAWLELQELVDAEVHRLPGHLQEVFVRCCLENSACNEIAADLQLDEGTVRSRLARARRILREQLGRKGICLSAALAIVAIAESRVAAKLVNNVTQAACEFRSGVSAPSGLVSANAISLAGQATRTIGFIPKLAFVFMLGVGIIGMGFAQLPSKPGDPPSTPKSASTKPTPETEKSDTDPLPANALARFGTLRFRAGGAVVALAFEPNGKRLASWSGNSNVADSFTLWEAETGKEIRVDQTANNEFMALAWPGSGVGVALLTKNYSSALRDLRIWEFSADKPTPLSAPRGGPPGVAVAPGANEKSCASTAFSPDGKYLAIATSTGETPSQVLVFESKANTAVTDLKQVAEFDAPPINCKSLSYSPDGKQLVGICPTLNGANKIEGCKLIVWNSDGKITKQVDCPTAAAQGKRMALAVSSERAAIGLEQGDTMVVELRTGKSRTLKTDHRSKSLGSGYGTFAVAFSPDGKHLATGGRDNMIKVSDVVSGKIVREFGPHGSWPEAIAYSPDGKRLASAGQDAVIRLWDPIAGNEIGPVGGHAGHVWRTSISADGKSVITSGGDEEIRVWDAAKGTERLRIRAGENVTFCKLSPDNKHVIAVVGAWKSSERTLRVWDLATGADATPAGFPKTLPVFGFRFTPDAKTLITFQDDKLNAWSWPDGKKQWAVDMPKPVKQPGINQVHSVSVSPDGKQFVTVADRYWYRDRDGLRFGYGADGVVDLWDTATGKRLRRLVESEACFRPGVYAAEGLYIHSGSGTFPGNGRGGAPFQIKASLCAIDPLTGRLVREFGQADRADGFDSGYTLALSADGKVLFRATGSGEVHAFEVASGRYRTAYAGHKDMVLALDTPTDVRRLVSSSRDTTAMLWNVGFVAVKPKSLEADERVKHWEALTDPDGKKAFESMRALAADPSGFIALAKAELKPAAKGPTAEELAPIFRDLDGKTFAIREAASKKLDNYGEGAIGLVRARLATELSAEVNVRLERFLDRCEGPGNLPTRLQQCRAIELIEHLGTKDGITLLEKLAQGGPSFMTADAKGALKRIKSR